MADHKCWRYLNLMRLKMKRLKRKARNGEREILVLQVENTFQIFTLTVLKDWFNSKPED